MQKQVFSITGGNNGKIEEARHNSAYEHYFHIRLKYAFLYVCLLFICYNYIL